MKSARICDDLCEHATSWLEEPVVTALYVSSGRDTRPLTFLHPDHLTQRGVGDVPAPNMFVYVDREPSLAHEEGFVFLDGRTTIVGAQPRTLPLGGLTAFSSRLTYESDRFTTRRYALVFVRATNQQFGVRAARAGWTPDYLISVNDGCAGFGRNDRCESLLTASGAANGLGPGHRYWVTDHVGRAPDAETVLHGGTLTGDRHSALEIRLLGLLSEQWSGPEVIGHLGGAALFEVEPAPCEPPSGGLAAADGSGQLGVHAAQKQAAGRL